MTQACDVFLVFLVDGTVFVTNHIFQNVGTLTKRGTETKLCSGVILLYCKSKTESRIEVMF